MMVENVRPSQHGFNFVAFHAVLRVLLAIPRGAWSLEISIGAAGDLEVSNGQVSTANRIIRKSRSPRLPLEDILSLQSVHQNKSLLDLHSLSDGGSSWNPKSEFVSPVSSDALDGQLINLSTPDPHVQYLLFNWDAGGAWGGERNDFDGEVGFEFTPKKNLTITALGRHVKGRWQQLQEGALESGRRLLQATTVTLWRVIPKADKSAAAGKDEKLSEEKRGNISATNASEGGRKGNESALAVRQLRPGKRKSKKNGQKTELKNGTDANATDFDVLKLVTVEVGPTAKVEAGGAYSFTDLEEPYEVFAHHKYRLTQRCWKGMKDVWFDGTAKETDVVQYALTECVAVGGGCHSEDSGGYPSKMEKEHRRLGMLNMRLSTANGTCGIALWDSISGGLPIR